MKELSHSIGKTLTDKVYITLVLVKSKQISHKT